MALAIIGGTPERFAPVPELHRRAAAEAGHPRPALGVNSHGFVAETSRRAADLAFPPFATMMNRIGRERGWAPMSRADFDASASLRGANFVGSPQQVIEKILYQHEIFGHDRFLMQLTVGTLPHDEVMRAIELFGTEVAPVVRREIAARRVEAAA
jgi:alkanesulfonate monooxygenase SsuD/methylene tetrahydromethanopterin reductase-like flavin-dependent oxidoreductase (luciferase family)